MRRRTLLCSGNREVVPTPERYLLHIRESMFRRGRRPCADSRWRSPRPPGGGDDTDRTDSRGGSRFKIRPTPSLQCPQVPRRCRSTATAPPATWAAVPDGSGATGGADGRATHAEHVHEGGGSIRRHGGCGGDRWIRFCRSAIQQLSHATRRPEPRHGFAGVQRGPVRNRSERSARRAGRVHPPRRRHPVDHHHHPDPPQRAGGDGHHLPAAAAEVGNPQSAPAAVGSGGNDGRRNVA